MALTTGTNSTSPNPIRWAGSDNDPYDRATQLAGPVENFEFHDHSEGKNLPVARLQYTNTPDAEGEVQVATDDLKWYGSGASAVQTAVRLAGTQTITGDKTFTGAVTLPAGVTLTTPTITVNDNALTLRDNGDTTKQAQFQLSGISAGQTRTYTVPDASTTLVGHDATQTLTNKTITSPTVTNGTFSTPTLTTPQINGAKLAVATPTTNYAAAVTDDVLLCNATGGAITITLPAAASSANKVLWVKKTDSSGYAVVLDGNGAETIDGAATLSISTQYQSYTVACDGVAWYVI
jgi:hypothetical protein